MAAGTTYSKIGRHRHMPPVCSPVLYNCPQFQFLDHMYNVGVLHSMALKGVLKTNFL